MRARGFGVRAFLLLLCLPFSIVCAQQSEDQNWEIPFIVEGSNSVVRTLAVSDGGLYLGGTFSSVRGYRATNITRWDGAMWSALGAGITGEVDTVVVSGSTVYAGGRFSDAGGVAAANVARWHGTNWSALGQGVNGYVFTLVTHGSDLYAGGRFTMAGNVNATNIAKWDGTNWSALRMGLSKANPQVGPTTFVRALAIQDGNLFAGGQFDRAGGMPAMNVARWDGTNWFPLGAGVSAPIYSLAVGERDLYAGGSFRRAGGTVASNVAKWNGTNWSTLSSGVNSGGISVVTALSWNGNDLFIGGQDFTQVGGVEASYIAGWNGEFWSALGSGVSQGQFGNAVYALAANGEQLFVGGYFGGAGGKAASNFAIWHIPHALKLDRSGDALRLSWPATGSNFVLEACASLSRSNWAAVPQAPAVSGRDLVVTNEVCGTTRFYRLRRR